MSTSLGILDKQASDLFSKSNNNFKTFEANLKKAGVDTIDAKLATEKYRKELTATRREVLGLGDDAKKTSRSMREIATGALRSIGEKAMNVPGMLVSGAVGAVGTIADKVVDVGKSLVDSVLEAAQFKQNSIAGLQAMLGSRKEAENIFKQAQQLALATPLDTKEVISGITQLVTAGGFKGDEATMLYKLIADQAALNLNDKRMQGKVIAAFSRVKGRGVATGEDLESMRVA
jgi:cysteinyl-tRNA synthetase